jgi:hypothetical protein
MRRTIAHATIAAALLAGCAQERARPGAEAEEGAVELAEGLDAAALQERIAQFAEATIDFDDSALEPWEKQVVAKLVAASDVIHDIFALQVSPMNPEWRARLVAADGAQAEAARRYYEIMMGPWDRLEDDAPFLAVGPKPAGAGYYPPDLTKEQFEAWLQAHPQDREAFTGYFTVIRREGDSLVAVPYSDEYRAQLEQAATLLREAADLSQNASLTDYLRKRADAFVSNDYFASDLAWMDIDARIEPTVGPYEVYEDRLFGYKAAFESFITYADSAASAELQRLKDHLRELERRLPIEDRYKNPDRGFESPIRVVDEIYTAGDARQGVQTTAFNLPNDVRVHEQKGSKKVMLRNVAQAKFDRILTPIGREVLADELATRIEFRPWFTNVVMHELAHGLGPSTITTPSGERMSVNQALRDHYSALEEAKADVVGLHNLTVLAEEGEYDAAFVEQAFIGHLADLFRAVRFGTGEAHGKANLVQFNYLVESGVLRHDEATGRFTADLARVMAANRDLAREILTIQARGAYDEASAFLERYGAVRPELESALRRLGSVPVDIKPHYAVVEKMRGWGSAPN